MSSISQAIAVDNFREATDSTFSEEKETFLDDD